MDARGALWIALVFSAAAGVALASPDLIHQADALLRELWSTPYTPGAAPALQARLKAAMGLYEQALDQNPHNTHILVTLSRCYFTLAEVFLPENEKRGAYLKGQEYGKRVLGTYPDFSRLERERGFAEAVRTIPDIAACAWTFTNWARRLELGGLMDLLAAVLLGEDRQLLALIERGLELDSGFMGGGPLRALGGYWAKHPFARDLEKARALFEEAIARYPWYLENRIFYVQYYLIPTGQWAKAGEQLQMVIEAPVGEEAFLNGWFKAVATRLLEGLSGTR